MSEEEYLNGNKTFPLIFHPQRQTFQGRAVNQVPVYIAQMDFRYDVADIWAGYEKQYSKRVFIKLTLNENLKESAAKYLDTEGVTDDHVYPE